MAEVYTEPTPSAFGPRPTDPGMPVPLDGDGTTTLDGIAAAFSRENYVAGAASAASATSGKAAHGAHRAAEPSRASHAARPANAGSPILSVSPTRWPVSASTWPPASSSASWGPPVLAKQRF